MEVSTTTKKKKRVGATRGRKRLHCKWCFSPSLVKVADTPCYACRDCKRLTTVAEARAVAEWERA